MPKQLTAINDQPRIFTIRVDDIRPTSTTRYAYDGELGDVDEGFENSFLKVIEYSEVERLKSALRQIAVMEEIEYEHGGAFRVAEQALSR